MEVQDGELRGTTEGGDLYYHHCSFFSTTLQCAKFNYPLLPLYQALQKVGKLEAETQSVDQVGICLLSVYDFLGSAIMLKYFLFFFCADEGADHASRSSAGEAGRQPGDLRGD